MKTTVHKLTIGAEQANRRIDNFLLSHLKPIAKSRVYQMLRRGEVRVNGGRTKPEYRLHETDVVRVPPVFERARHAPARPPTQLLETIADSIIHEDARLLVINKPSGIAAHAGSGRTFGVIELLRALYGQQQALHLAHRLDRETSGCLLVIKNMPLLRRVNRLLQEGKAQKDYLTLLQGRLRRRQTTVDVPLQRQGNRSGANQVKADPHGKAARTTFTRLKLYANASYARVSAATGRTHQIRVHAQSIGHPLAGDDKYGDRAFNKTLRATGLRRLFLHASVLVIPDLEDSGPCRFTAPLPAELDAALARLGADS